MFVLHLSSYPQLSFIHVCILFCFGYFCLFKMTRLIETFMSLNETNECFQNIELVQV